MSVCVTEKVKYLYALLNLPWNHLQSCHHHNLLYVDIPWYPMPCKDYALQHVGVGNIVIEFGSSWYQEIRQQGVMSWKNLTL